VTQLAAGSAATRGSARKFGDDADLQADGLRADVPHDEILAHALPT